MTQLRKSLYDPAKTYEENFNEGPFGDAIDSPYQDTGEPQFEVFGHQVYSPFGIPAGPLLNSKYVKYKFDRGFDVLVYKTQRTVPFEVNQHPNVLYVDVDGDLTLEKAAQPLVGYPTTNKSVEEFSITNSFAMPSKGPGYWVEDMQRAIAYQRNGQLLIMGVVGTIQDGFGKEDYYNDFADAAELAVKGGAKVVEVNLSCPNVANEGVLCYTEKAVDAITSKVKNRIKDTPIIIKVGYYAPEQQDLLERIVKTATPYVDGISAINTIAAPIVNDRGEQALPGPNRLKSGVCGASIKWAGLDTTRRLKDLRTKLGVNFEIVGVGGVMSAADYREYRDAGADLVQSATGAMWNPDLAAQIKAGRL